MRSLGEYILQSFVKSSEKTGGIEELLLHKLRQASDCSIFVRNTSEILSEIAKFSNFLNTRFSEYI